MKCVFSYFNTKTYKSQPRRQNASGFTIVELLIVVVVIAILAAIVIVSYTGIQKNAINSSVKSALASASTAMKLAAVESGGFSSIPGTVNPPNEIGLALTELESPLSASSSFCMNGTYQGHDDVAFHITEAGDLMEGLCDGDVIIGTVVGNYNYEAAGGSAPEDIGYTPIVPGVSEASDYGFKVATNLEWTNVTISWDPQPGAVRYEVQTNTPYSNWAYRTVAAGSGSHSGTSNTSFSGAIPSSTTSLNWTDTNYAVPSSVGRTYDYRMRPCASSSVCGDWTEVSLSNPIQTGSSLPSVGSFTVQPAADWSNVVLSWDEVPRYAANMDTVRYEVQTSTPYSNWAFRTVAAGASSNTSTSNTSFSGALQRSTTSLTWTDTNYAVPSSVGRTYEYRIRTCADSSQTFCGDWTQVSLANPIQSASSVPDVSNFTVVPAPGWSSVVLSWDEAPSYSTNMSVVRYEVQTSTPYAAWAFRTVVSGSSSTTSTTNTSFSGALPRSTTSLTWTETNHAVPSSGQTYQYRIRNCADNTQDFCGEWQTRSLAR